MARKSLIAAAAYPLHVITHAVGVHVEVHADAGFTEMDAVVGEVDDDGAAAAPGVRRTQCGEQQCPLARCV